ncbi:hypothetical protein BELL_0244g00100 [Botrytis elliptica]|uniref:Uncharacterized protein n=1 Tax=Botrytis elliptica TaxID=278938 RepID=A0A4Z1JMT7_9HELO|nr:hypothetical protein BELL_0244g00100 [Botrytis elliptica]
MLDKGTLNDKCDEAEFEGHDILFVPNIDILEGLWPEKQGSQCSTYPDNAQLIFISNFLLDFPTKLIFVKFETLLVSFQPYTTIQLMNRNKDRMWQGRIKLAHENCEIAAQSPIQLKVLPAMKRPFRQDSQHPQSQECMQYHQVERGFNVLF